MLAETLFRRHSDGFYRCVRFSDWGWLHHGFGTRDSPLPSGGVTTLRQIHSAEVRNARDIEDRACAGDALISNELGKTIGVRTADCVPILLADPQGHTVAIIHAGWRGTAASIARHAVEKLTEDFGVAPDNIHAALGPAIRVCCYQVGWEVAQHFQPFFPEWDGSQHTGDRMMLDLIEANRRVLIAAGVPASQIYDSELCTFCRAAEFFSYRREPDDPGRMISFAARIA